MTYLHCKKAGNIGDVWKHFALAEIFSSLPASNIKQYIETHAGAGIYKLEEANKNTEWGKGIARVANKPETKGCAFITKCLKVYNPNVTFPGLYPGSAIIAKELLPKTKHILFETSKDVARSLRDNFKEADVRIEDGLNGCAKAIRDNSIVFIDPPYTKHKPDRFMKKDWAALGDNITSIYNNNRSNVIIVWYPIYTLTNPNVLASECASLIRNLVNIQCLVGDPNKRPHDQSLKGSGLLVIGIEDPSLTNKLIHLSGILSNLMKHNIANGEKGED